MLFGRTEERGTLAQLLEDVRRSRSRALVVCGEAGLGKTALIEDAVTGAAGLRVLRAAGVESEVELPFAILHQLLWPVAGGIDRLPAPQAAALRGAFGIDPVPGDRFLVGVAALTLLAETAESGPLLVVIDDAHWVDAPSAEALLFVARRLEAEPIGMLLAAREPLPAAFERTGLPALRLGGLDRVAARQLMVARHADLAPHVSERLLAEFAGNPLAIIELTSSLTAGQRAGRESIPTPLPLSAGLERAYLAQVGRLPAETQLLLTVAAADETGSTATILAAARGLGIPASALGPAERAGLVQADERHLRFGHPLVRSAIYHGALLSERIDAHRALAGVLTGEGQEDSRMCHLAAAAVGPDEEAAAALEQAAHRTMVRRAPGVAVAQLERAAELSADPLARARRLASAAETAIHIGQHDRARLFVDAAEPLTPDGEVRIALSLSRAEVEYLMLGVDSAVGTLLHAAEVAAHDPAQAARCIVRAGELAWTANDGSLVAEVYRRLLALPAAAGLPVDRAARSLAVRGPERPTDWCTYLASLWDWLSFPGGTSERRIRPALAACAAGEEVAAHRAYLREVAELRAAGALGDLVAALCELCSLEIVLGRWRDASATGDEAMRLAVDSGQRLITRAVQVRLARIAAYQGRAAECRELAAAATEAGGTPPHGGVRPLVLWPLGVLELGSGRWEAAYANLAAMSESPPWASGWHAVVAAGDYVEAAVHTGHLDEATQAVAELRTWGMPDPPGWLRHVLGRCEAQIAAGRAAEDAFLAALAVPNAGSRPFELARTQLAFGQWLRRERRRAEARLQLRAAVETFDQLGAAPWSDQARRELRATGETIRRRDEVVLDRLTPQELQITRLAAQGMSNKEIGSRLFMSPRTVESHLYKVFPKLGIGSRADLRNLQLEDAAAAG